MAAIAPNVAPSAPAETIPVRRFRSQLVLWRIGIFLSLAVLGFFWARSWSRIHHGFIPVGPGGIECLLAGSSGAVSITSSPRDILDFGESLGPPDAEHLLHYDARWIDGESLGRVANSCLFPPSVDSLTRLDLDRIGSFGAMFSQLPTPAGPESFLHLRVPFWFLMAAGIAGWIWLERFSLRRRRHGVQC